MSNNSVKMRGILSNYCENVLGKNVTRLQHEKYTIYCFLIKDVPMFLYKV
jgi:hypothetical protein